jgi:hypothetical protein
LCASNVPGRPDHGDKSGFEAGSGIDGKVLPLERVGGRDQHFDRLAGLQRRRDPIVDASARLLARMALAVLIEPGSKAV